MNSSRALRVALLAITLAIRGDASPPQAAPSAAVAIWNFEDAALGSVPSGAQVVRGSWEIRGLRDAPAGPKALVQTAHNHGSTFNLIVFSKPQLKDVDLRVQLKALEGREDQGGGVVWRYRDVGSYYVARANPLEKNFRVYKLENGRRQQLQGASLTIDPGWHRLRVTMRGNQIECYLDGQSYLRISDNAFADAGRIGLWTKADAVTAFDDLSVSPNIESHK